MSLALIGRKVGMTRVFTEDGTSIPVTVLEVLPNRVTQIKTIASDGYTSLQLAYGATKATKLDKALTGHYAKAGVTAGTGLHETAIKEEDVANFPLGTNITVENFKEGQLVDVTGTSIGKGYAGVIKNVTDIVNYDPRVKVDNIVVDQYEYGLQIQCTLLYLDYSISEELVFRFDRENGLL